MSSVLSLSVCLVALCLLSSCLFRSEMSVSHPPDQDKQTYHHHYTTHQLDPLCLCLSLAHSSGHNAYLRNLRTISAMIESAALLPQARSSSSLSLSHTHTHTLTHTHRLDDAVEPVRFFSLNLPLDFSVVKTKKKDGVVVHSLTHLTHLTRSPTHSLTHLLTCSLTHSP